MKKIYFISQFKLMNVHRLEMFGGLLGGATAFGVSGNVSSCKFVIIINLIIERVNKLKKNYDISKM